MARPPKKSETFEVRLPYATKQALMARSQADGRAASEIVRGFIDGYLAGPANPSWTVSGAVETARAHGRFAAVMVVALVSLAGISLAVSPATAARPDVAATFQRLDSNQDGRLDVEEFARFVRP